MDAPGFDRWTRSLTDTASRRSVLGLAGAALGLAAARNPGITEAKKKHKKKSKKPQLNEYGCLNVGQACGGNSDRCCSGICTGKKPKKGKKDKSTCAAHNAGICKLDSCAEGKLVGCQPDTDSIYCVTTTGNANFCADLTVPDDICRDCQRDIDCEAEFGPGAACIVLGGVCIDLCAETNGTACAPAGA